MAGTVAVAALVALAGLWAVSALAPTPASATPPSPHLSTGAATDNCAACHRSHTSQNSNLSKSPSPPSTLCLSCHDGTGSSYNVAAEYSDPNVPANDASTASYYSHSLANGAIHTSAQVDEFGGVLNRHSECVDCHSPHHSSNEVPVQTQYGWTASGSTTGITGVSNLLAWKNPINYEYELCLKCHSRYTKLLTSSKPSYQMTDVAGEFDPGNASYHPVESPGKNDTPALQNSLAGGKLWQFTVGSVIRCTNCHGNYRLVGSPPVPNTPAVTARLAPHASEYRGLLIANYRDRDLKAASEAYSSGDFSLCYLCHSEAPFTDTSGNSRTDTNFSWHGYHVGVIGGPNNASLDIDTAGAGQGKALCAECHYRVHGTKLAPWTANQYNPRGVNFAPDVQPKLGLPAPDWSAASRTCNLVCHAEVHDNYSY